MAKKAEMSSTCRVVQIIGALTKGNEPDTTVHLLTQCE